MRKVKTATLDDNGAVNFGSIADPTIQVSGTWGGGTVTVKLDGVALLETHTSDFELIYDTLGAPARVDIVLASATTPDLDINVIGSTLYGAAVSGR